MVKAAVYTWKASWMQTILYIEGHADGVEVSKALLAEHGRTMIVGAAVRTGWRLPRSMSRT